MTLNPTATPDITPGNYYVSAVDGERRTLLLGPFPNDHQAALDLVPEAIQIAREMNPRSWFWIFGTVRLPIYYTKLGILNGYTQQEIIQ